VSDAYLREWAAQLALRFPELGAIADLGTMRTSELAGLIAFLEGYRARTEAMAA
jgi:hypothetical protein